MKFRPRFNLGQIGKGCSVNSPRQGAAVLLFGKSCLVVLIYKRGRDLESFGLAGWRQGKSEVFLGYEKRLRECQELSHQSFALFPVCHIRKSSETSVTRSLTLYWFLWPPLWVAYENIVTAVYHKTKHKHLTCSIFPENIIERMATSQSQGVLKMCGVWCLFCFILIFFSWVTEIKG